MGGLGVGSRRDDGRRSSGGGARRVALLYGLCIAGSVWVWCRLSRAAGGNFLLTCLFFVPLLSAMALHWLARPHVFSWLFLPGTVWLCEQMPDRPDGRALILAAAGSALWANLHASFFLAPVLFLIYAAGAYLRPLVWRGVAGPQGAGYLRFAMAASLGSLANPSGWRLHQHIIDYLADSALLNRITEFQSFNFLQDGAIRITMMLAICFAGAFAALAAGKPARFLLSISLTAMALRSVRVLPLAALMLLPLANASITTVLRGASGLTPALRRGLDRALEYGDRLLVIDRGLRGFALIPLFAILVFASIRDRAGFVPDESPVAASEVVALLPVDARIFSSDGFGGYLIYRFAGERKVFFDGRSDFYGDDFLDRYQRMLDARPGWRGEFNRWKFTHALVPPDCPLVAALEASGWQELYRDHTAVLLSGSSRI
jgi:hypothetical protein